MTSSDGRFRIAPSPLVALVAIVAVLPALTGCPIRSSGGTNTTGDNLPTPPLPSGGGEGELAAETLRMVKDSVVQVQVELDFPVGPRHMSGSGFVVSKERRLLITNAHVVSLVVGEEEGAPEVASARHVSVVFRPGTDEERTVPAKVRREHADIDLAVLEIDEEPAAELKLADSDAVSETARVYGCGHPLGRPEFSIRSGSITARRKWDDRSYLEHDAGSERGGSGGPVVDPKGRVVGINTRSLRGVFMESTWVIPANVLRDWLASSASDDPKRVSPGAPDDPVRQLLARAGIAVEQEEGGLLAWEAANGMVLFAHEVQGFLRVGGLIGALPGETEDERGEWALKALRLNYDDPIGHLSLSETEEGYKVYWEATVPMSEVTPEHVAKLGEVGAVQAYNWAATVRGDETTDVSGLFPGGDKEELRSELQAILDAADLKYETTDSGVFKLPYDSGVEVYADIYRGMVYTHAYVGGMPGYADESWDVNAAGIDLLRRNWDDAFGRLSVDGDYDVVWESQVPVEFLTPDYLTLIAANCAGQIEAYWDNYGDVPLLGG